MVKKVYAFRAVIEPDEPSGYHGYVPALPGCHTCGDTIEETEENLEEAILGVLETMVSHKVPIPEDQTVDVIQRVEVSSEYAALPLIKS